MKSKVLSVSSALRAALLCALCVLLLCGCGPAPTGASSAASPASVDTSPVAGPSTSSVSLYPPIDVAGALSISEKQLYLIKTQWPLKTVHFTDFGTLNMVSVTIQEGVTCLAFDFSTKASLDALYDKLSTYIDGTWEVTDSYFSSLDGKAEGVALQCSVNAYAPESDADECSVFFMFPFEEGNNVLEVILEAHWPGEAFEVPELNDMVCSKSLSVSFYDAGGYSVGSISISGSWLLAGEAEQYGLAYQAIIERMAATEGFVRDDAYDSDITQISFHVGNAIAYVSNDADSIYVSYRADIEQCWVVTGG